MKRNAMAAPFEQAFDEFASLAEQASHYVSESAPAGIKDGGEVRAIHYREEEAIYIKASFDRVTVIFSTVFREETDRIYGKVFLQEFVDARKRGVQNAPQVLFRNEPPLELQGQPGLATGKGEVGYITFDENKPSHTSRRFEITSTITSKPAKRIFTVACEDEQQTSCKYFEEQGQRRRKKSVKLLAGAHSGYKDEQVILCVDILKLYPSSKKQHSK
nr:actin-related protein 2/3 complex subunit 2 [Quercus suber]